MKYDFISTASQEDFLSSEHVSRNIQHHNRPKLSSMSIFVVSCAALGLVGMVGMSYIPNNSIHRDISFKKEVIADEIWTLNRKDYEPLDYFLSTGRDYMTYKFLEGYNTVVEPYADMRLYIQDYSDENQFYYTFEVCVVNATSPCHSGYLMTGDDGLSYKDVTVPCSPFQQVSIKVQRYSKSGMWQKELTGTGMCIYVRREIRNLSPSDLNATMDAMYKLWSTSDVEGQQIYGADFHNITYLLQMHHFNAAWRDADHFHEGNGFMAQHMKMTNIFETSIQAVNPSISVPFWDFTIEESEGLHAYDSHIMSAEMFGSMMPPTNNTYSYTYENDQIVDFAIKNGRWAYTKAEMNPTKFSSLQAGFGYMRSPWNMNPSPYVSRFTGTSLLPKCTTHYEMLSYTDMMSFMVEMETNPHASTHGDIGGSFGCDSFKPLLDAGYINDEDTVVKICKTWIFTLKSLYRKNMIRPKDCDVPSESETQDANCPFICVDTDDDWESALSTQWGTVFILILPGTAELSWWSGRLLQKLLKGYVPSNMDDTGKDMWSDFVCGGDAARVFGGDHAESASPSDPSFWPIHPSLERLYHAKMMVGGFETTDWGVDAVEDDVCIRSECYENGQSGEWDQCCYGHFEDSQMLDFVSGKKEQYYGPTNGDTMTASDPTSAAYSMSYIYDGFDWGHCDEADFSELLSELYDASIARRRLN